MCRVCVEIADGMDLGGCGVGWLCGFDAVGVAAPRRRKVKGMSDRTIEALHVGMAAELAKTYDAWDINTFAALTGDLNPAHVDEAFAERTIFKEKIAHGTLTASLVSAVLGMKLPGPGSIYLSQELRFLRPVRIGDTVTARVEVIEVVRDEKLVKLRTTCTNQRGELVLDGTALVRPPVSELTKSETEAVKPDLRPETRRLQEHWDPARPRRRGVLVGGWMRSNPLTISPKDSLAEARALLDLHRIRHLPVVEEENLVGILAARDISQASLPGPAGPPTPETDALLKITRVGDVMAQAVITITPEATIGEAAILLVSHKIGALPCDSRCTWIPSAAATPGQHLGNRASRPTVLRTILMSLFVITVQVRGHRHRRLIN